MIGSKLSNQIVMTAAILFIRRRTPTRPCVQQCRPVRCPCADLKSDADEWSGDIDVNVRGTFNVLSDVLPVMMRADRGIIVNRGAADGRFRLCDSKAGARR